MSVGQSNTATVDGVYWYYTKNKEYSAFFSNERIGENNKVVNLKRKYKRKTWVESLR